MQPTRNIQKSVPNKHSALCSKYPSHQNYWQNTWMVRYR